ncbi:MAG: S-layer homology domain-containing protein [Oscillospiraceae bacterium]|nr:S-layer homology domain-containing protein [Oscillospiraceae bacterium]MBQ9985665.1 S-layer homology domain-containing protein [Oscillospiraceae bacterium]
MKKTLKILAIVTALAAVLSVCAFAANFEHCGDALNELGLFKGTQNGYELDREPTRAEAATMLVRLLGAEEEALVLPYTAPFGDVADWAKPYVQYLYDKGLTKGTSETTFGYSDKCTAQQYATFLLRALGYSDGVDFTYDTALTYGEKIGLCDWANCFGEVFLRDNVVAMSYTALSMPTKSGDVDLLSKLVSSGAVKDAKGYDAFFADMRAYIAATESLNTAKKLSADIIIERGEEKEIAKYAIERNDEDIDKSKMSYVAENKAFSSYYADGVLYLDMGDDMKVKKASSYMSAVSYIAPAVSYDPISVIRTIEKKTEGNSVIYMTALRHEILTAMTVIGDAQYTSDMTVEVKVENGRTVEINTVTEALLAGAPGRQTIKYDNIKTGDDVKVTLPDNLDEFEAPETKNANEINE